MFATLPLARTMLNAAGTCLSCSVRFWSIKEVWHPFWERKGTCSVNFEGLWADRVGTKVLRRQWSKSNACRDFTVPATQCGFRAWWVVYIDVLLTKGILRMSLDESYTVFALLLQLLSPQRGIPNISFSTAETPRISVVNPGTWEWGQYFAVLMCSNLEPRRCDGRKMLSTAT